VHLALAVNEREIPVQGGACRMEEQANLRVIIPDNAQRSLRWREWVRFLSLSPFIPGHAAFPK